MIYTAIEEIYFNVKRNEKFKFVRSLNYVSFTQILIILGQILSGMVEI